MFKIKNHYFFKKEEKLLSDIFYRSNSSNRPPSLPLRCNLITAFLEISIAVNIRSFKTNRYILSFTNSSFSKSSKRREKIHAKAIFHCVFVIVYDQKLPETTLKLWCSCTEDDYVAIRMQWCWSFPGGSVVKKSACQCRRPGFNPWPGKIPRAMEQLSPCAPLSLCPGARALRQEKPPQWEAHTPQLESSPRSPQLEESLCSKEAPAQPKINE